MSRAFASVGHPLSDREFGYTWMFLDDHSGARVTEHSIIAELGCYLANRACWIRLHHDVKHFSQV